MRNPGNVFFERGWCRFAFDPALMSWIEGALPAARATLRDPTQAKWLRYRGTWFAGVNALPNDAAGAVAGSGPLRGDAVDFIGRELGLKDLHWDAAQVSVCFPGYPRPMAGESQARTRFRRERDAAHAIGVSPEPVYHEAGALVIRFVDGKVFSEADVRDERNLARIVDLLQVFHRQMPRRFDGIAVLFWVFQVLRHYRNLLEQGGSAHAARLPALARIADKLESAVGKVDILFGHNDLLAANFIDDGERIWLIDFDYAGFNSPLFDLSNLASNNELDETGEHAMLAQYFGRAPDEALLASYHAMKCASLLRETMWSMVSELYSRVDMDFADYTQKNLGRFETVYAAYKSNYH